MYRINDSKDEISVKPAIVKKVSTYLTKAINLQKGDKILTNRFSVAEITNAVTSHDSTDRLCVHLFSGSKGIPVTGHVFLADEMVLIVK